MWLERKRIEPAAEAELENGLDLVSSLGQVGIESGLEPQEMFLSIVFSPGGDEESLSRTDILIGDGTRLAEWRVESLRSLFRGSRQPPPDAEMEHYPEAYVPFFYRVEYNVFRYCRTMEQSPTDGELLEIYSKMRRQPDGRSLGRVHDVIWQSAALVLGLRPWSEAEYTAVFGQLARSARHFRMGPGSRNYMTYVQAHVGGEA